MINDLGFLTHLTDEEIEVAKFYYVFHKKLHGDEAMTKTWLDLQSDIPRLRAFNGALNFNDVIDASKGFR